MSKKQAALENLKKSLKLITPTSSWIQGTLYRQNKKGEVTGFCALGVVSFVDGTGERLASKYLEQSCYELFNSRRVAVINDSKPKVKAHKNVLKMFRRAIKIAQSKVKGNK